jgi:hypothetical protein
LQDDDPIMSTEFDGLLLQFLPRGPPQPSTPDHHH